MPEAAVPTPSEVMFGPEVLAYDDAARPPRNEALLAEIVPMYAELTNKPVVLATIPVFARTDRVPVVVIVPPVKPLVVATEVTPVADGDAQ